VKPGGCRARRREEQRPLFSDDFAGNYELHSRAGDFDREEMRGYFAAPRASFIDLTIRRRNVLVDGNFVTSHSVMAGRLDKESPLRRSAPFRRTADRCSVAGRAQSGADDGRLEHASAL
jgi:hypothetical protein